MVLIYALIRSLTVFLRKTAEFSHRRAKKTYEQLEQAFSELETECKADEVAVGRPVDYTAQLRLLKSFEQKEQARRRWVRKAARLTRRQRLETRAASIGGRKIPYTSGLIDMALMFKFFDLCNVFRRLDVNQYVEALFSSLK